MLCTYHDFCYKPTLYQLIVSTFNIFALSPLETDNYRHIIASGYMRTVICKRLYANNIKRGK